MHKKKFLVCSLSFLAVLALPSEIFGQRKGPPGLISFRQESILALENLKKNLKTEKDVTKQFSLVESYKVEFQKSRAKAPRQLETDEIFLNLLEGALSHLPSSTDFNKKSCKSYRLKILFEMNPKEEKPTPEPVAKALEILKILCR